MYAMRIQQELAAKGFEAPRPRSPQARAAADADEALRFVARSLAWERRLAQLRAQAAAKLTTADDEASSTPATPATGPTPSTRPTPVRRPATPVLT
jgi:hypothetical protein